MRRLVLEMDADDVAPYEDELDIRNFELMEVLSFLNEDPNEFALVCRIRFKDPSTRVSQVIRDSHAATFRLLSKEKDGSYIFFMKSKPASHEDGSSWWHTGGYVTRPFEIRDGKVKISFIGQPKEVRGFLNMVDEIGVKYRVDLLTDAKFSPDSPLGRLTDKQRAALTMAYNLGYYDIPRKIDTDELARKLKIRNPTFVMHRRKAEKAALKGLLSEV